VPRYVIWRRHPLDVKKKGRNDMQEAFSLLNDRKCLRGCFFHYNGFLSELMNIYLKGSVCGVCAL